MKHQARQRTAVFLALLAAGLLGMLATGSGVWPGPTWPWLVLLLSALVWAVAHRHVSVTARVLARCDVVERGFVDMAERVAGVWTSETGRRLVENQNRMGEGLNRLEERARLEDQKQAYQRAVE